MKGLHLKMVFLLEVALPHQVVKVVEDIQSPHLLWLLLTAVLVVLLDHQVAWIWLLDHHDSVTVHHTLYAH